MIFPTTITRYIFKELFSPFIVSLFFLSFVFLMAKIPEFTNMIVNYHTGIISLVLLLLYSFPKFLLIILPISVMISVLLTFMRMAGDNEITALKGGGISLYRLLPPVLGFSFFITCIALFVSIFIVPKSMTAIEDKSKDIIQASLDIALQERVFNTDIEGIMIYIASVNSVNKKLNNVFIEDSRTKGMVNISTAPQGMLLLSKNKKKYTLRLFNGIINQVNLIKDSVNTISFASYDINIDCGKLFNKSRVKRKKQMDEMDLQELVKVIKDNKHKKNHAFNMALMEFHNMFALPFACFCLALLAFPLGVQSVSLKKSSGLGLGLVFFVVYYLLFAIGWSAGESGAYPPVIGMWFPNVFMLIIGLYLLYRNAKEHPVKMPYLFVKVFLFIKIHIFKKKADF